MADADIEFVSKTLNKANFADLTFAKVIVGFQNWLLVESSNPKYFAEFI